MLRLAVIGTNWISARFVSAALETNKYQLQAVYSRQEASASTFAEQFGGAKRYTSLQQLASDPDIDVVYIASPNSLHCEQSCELMQAGKHIICEKPMAANYQQVQAMLHCARQHQVILFEAFKTRYLPNFAHLRQALPSVGKIRKVLFQYCQYSSRYQRYLEGELPNAFNPQFANGSLMDIGFYPLASCLTLWGEPQHITAYASLLDSGVDAHGTILLNYGDFDVTIMHSKVSDSHLESEIQGEHGAIQIHHLSVCENVTLTTRDGQYQHHQIGQSQVNNEMVYEAEQVAQLIRDKHIEHEGLALSLLCAKVMTAIRQQIGVSYPADD